MRPTDATRADNSARWSVAGLFLEGFAVRDYERVAATLDPHVRFRALFPRGPSEWQGPQAVADALQSWFGSAEEFEVVDATIGDVAGRLHMSWRVRVRPAPTGIGDGWHLIEQHAYADVAGSIEALDVLCSGFRAEPMNEKGM